MSAMAAAPPPAPRFDSVLSFSDAPSPPADAAESATAALAFSDAGSDTDTDADAEFEFAFAPPLSPRAGGPALAPADDLFAHGRIVPAYPLFDRHLFVADDHGDDQASSAASSPGHPRQQASTAPPSPDTYCAWAPRSAPGSPSRGRDNPAFPKSASTGEARRFWRLRGLVSGGGGRSHSDGKEKFAFLQSSRSPDPAAAPSAADGKRAATAAKAAAASPAQKQQGKKKKGGSGKAAAGATEMDMATAHRLFYGKPGAAATAVAGDRSRQQQSYLPYRPGIVGFFTAAHALGRSHHPY